MKGSFASNAFPSSRETRQRRPTDAAREDLH